MYHEQQIATMFTALMSAICTIAVFICYWYPVQSALVVWSVVSIVFSYIVVRKQRWKIVLSFVLDAVLVAPLVLSMKNFWSEETEQLLAFIAISATVVTFSTVLLERRLRRSSVTRVLQLTKRFIELRRLRIALSLFSISLYAASISILSPILDSPSLFFISGIAICVIMNTVLSDIYQKKNEFLTLAVVGLNPDHFVGLVFAESLIISFVGGGIGYGFGYWIKYLTIPSSEFGLSLATMVEVILVSNTVGFIASIIPASRASMMMTPSLLKRWWREAQPSEEWPPKWTFALPIKVTEDNVEEFLFFYMKRLPISEWFTKNIERVYDLHLEYPEPEKTSQRKTWKLNFRYSYGDGTRALKAANELAASKSLESDEIKVTLTIKVLDYDDPQFAQMMDKYMEMMGSAFRMLAFEWTKEAEHPNQ